MAFNLFSKKHEPADPDPGKSEQDKIAEAIAAFQDIESLLHQEEETVRIPLKDILPAVPESFRASGAPDPAGQTIELVIPNLFFQLSKGKVTLPLSNLAAVIPQGFLLPKAAGERDTEVRLPLPAIVKAIDPALLRERTAKKAAKIRPDGMPDPFARKVPATPPSAPTPAAASPIPPSVSKPAAATPPPAPSAAAKTPPLAPVAPPTPPRVEPPPEEQPVPPSEEPVAVTAEKTAPVAEEPVAPTPPPVVPPVPESASPPVPTPVLPRSPVSPPPVTPPVPSAQVPATKPKSPRPAPKTRPPVVEDEVGAEDIGAFGGININTAGVAQLMELESMTTSLAESIVQHRTEHGPFKTIFDLQDVPRLGRKTFRRITGMAYSKARKHRSLKLAKLVKLSATKIGHLPTLAAAVAGLPGFSGCVIADRDGLLLAQSGADEIAVALGGVMPKILSQTQTNMGLLNIEKPDSISIAVKEHMFTLVECDRVCLAAIHEKAKLARRQIVLIRKIARELTWLLSRRAYVGA